MSFKKDATHIRREFICDTIHNYKVGSKKNIYLILSIVLKISASTVRSIHKTWCRFNQFTNEEYENWLNRVVDKLKKETMEINPIEKDNVIFGRTNIGEERDKEFPVSKFIPKRSSIKLWK